MPNLYRNESSDPKTNAQRNLSGRSHYCDDDTLRYFHSRIISSRHTDGGLLFALVESVAKDHENRSRGFRFVIFDLFGATIDRKTDRYWSTSERATKAMWEALNAIDAEAVTRAAIANAEKSYALELQRTCEALQKCIAEGYVHPVKAKESVA